MSQSLFSNISLEDFLGSPHSSISVEEADVALVDSMRELDRLTFALPRLEYLQAGIESSTEELSVQTISVIDFAVESLLGPEAYSTEAFSAAKIFGGVKKASGLVLTGVLIMAATLLRMLANLGVFLAAAIKAISIQIARPFRWAVNKFKKPPTPNSTSMRLDGPVEVIEIHQMPQALANKFRSDNRYATTPDAALDLLHDLPRRIRNGLHKKQELFGAKMQERGDVLRLGENPLSEHNFSRQDLEAFDQTLKSVLLPTLKDYQTYQSELAFEVTKLKNRDNLTPEKQAWIKAQLVEIGLNANIVRSAVSIAQSLGNWLHLTS
jgi:hypothetical protein